MRIHWWLYLYSMCNDFNLYSWLIIEKLLNTNKKKDRILLQRYEVSLTRHLCTLLWCVKQLSQVSWKSLKCDLDHQPKLLTCALYNSSQWTTRISRVTWQSFKECGRYADSTINLSTARPHALVFMIYASLAWTLIIIWKPYRSIIISLTNYRTRWWW